MADNDAELDEAIADIKRQLGVETTTADLIARLLPPHLRQPFWRRAVDRYLTDQLAAAEHARDAGQENP